MRIEIQRTDIVSAAVPPADAMDLDPKPWPEPQEYPARYAPTPAGINLPGRYSFFGPENDLFFNPWIENG